MNLIYHISNNSVPNYMLIRGTAFMTIFIDLLALGSLKKQRYIY